MSKSEKQVEAVPLYPESYSGIPARLLPKALKEKSRLEASLTKGTSTPRKRGIAIPAGVSQQALLRALEELSGKLGQENVELNDRPLRDGW